MRRIFAFVLMLGLLMSTLSGCGGETSSDGESPGYKDSIVWVTQSDQDCLDPQTNVSNSKVLPQVYEGLLGFDNNNQVVCRIAESYESSEDGMVWTFHLRDDVYFHSGKQCTAYDFEATFDRLLDRDNPGRYTNNYKHIASAEATDEYTFVITLSEPKAFFLETLALRMTAAMNSEYLEKYGDDIGNSVESVDGCGPFRVTSWSKGEELRLERFDDYYGDVALTKEVVIQVVPEQTSRAIAVETGQADLADGLSPDDVARLEGMEGLQVSKTDGNGCHIFQFNCASDKAPIADARVRQAISYAIDRERICDTLYSGLDEHPIDSMWAPNVASYHQVGVVPYDLDKAKELLAEAGYADGFDMTVMTTAVYNHGIEMGEMIAEMLKEVNINVTLEVVELAVFNSAWGEFTPEEFNERFGWDMFIMGFGGAAEPETTTYRTLHTDEGRNLNNYGYYSNAEVDTLLETASRTMDVEERDACYARIAEIAINEDPFGVFMNLRKNVYVMSDRMENFAVNPSNTIDWTHLVCRAD